MSSLLSLFLTVRRVHTSAGICRSNLLGRNTLNAIEDRRLINMQYTNFADTSF